MLVYFPCSTHAHNGLLFQIVVFAAVVAVAVAFPQTGKDAQITAYSNDVALDGYNFA